MKHGVVLQCFQKNFPVTLTPNSVKNEPILIIFCIQHLEETSH